ncbi:MAG: TonB-dependent receptor [Silvibacterium sp.]
MRFLSPFSAACFVALLILIFSARQAAAQTTSTAQANPDKQASPDIQTTATADSVKAAPANQQPHDSQTVVVLGSSVPIPLTESTSSVVVLPVQSQILSLESVQDLLRQDSSLYIEDRGSGGGQADIILRGGTYEQVLVLLNGFRINDAQSSHHNLDIPLPMDAIDSIEVLHGAGSTLHGADALSGVVDFITAAPQSTSVRLRAGGGSFGENEEGFLGDLLQKSWSSRLTAERNFSTGFIADRDYRNEDASSESWFNSRLGLSDILLATSDRSFGALNFYGIAPQWERTKGWFASGRQELGERTEAAFGYRRHTDEYVWERYDPSVYENNHIDESWQASLRNKQPIASNSVLLIGLDADGDSIQSTNLGNYARNRGAGYADFNLRPANARWNLSAGVREELFSGGLRSVTSPHLAGSLRLPHQLKLRGNAGYGFRLPTYTDLYYHAPGEYGNPNLKPESVWSFEGGADWDLSNKWSLSATGFYSRQHDTIDIAEATKTPNALPSWCPLNVYCAVNVNGVHFSGVEASATWTPSSGQRVELAWTQLFGSQAPLLNTISEVALNYPDTNIHLNWIASIRNTVTITNSVAVVRPYQQSSTPWNDNPYPVWNLDVARESGRIRPYVRLTNLSNTGYEELTNIAMPGRAVVAGISIKIGD